MHTNEPTRHITIINGNLYYNRRVPSHAQGAFGQQVRVRIGSTAEADRLTRRLNDIWAEEDFSVAVDIQSLLAATTTKQANLSAIAREYVDIRGIQENPTISSALLLAQLSGDMVIDAYGRQDARNFVQVLLQRGMRTTSIRRRLNCLSAIFNYAYAEYEIEGRNPFTRVVIPKEGADRERRLPIATEALHELYEACMASEKPLRWAIPILGETGCRIAEIIGLRRSDVLPDASRISIVAHSARRLKTSGSERDLPLVGYAQKAMQKLLNHNTENEFLFSSYLRDGEILATHAGNTLNKWLKQQTDGKTAHCLRHAFRDRLRAVECPLELLDALGGWSNVQGAGSRYGTGYTVEQKRNWLEKTAVLAEVQPMQT
jgi:integrase